MLSILSSAVWIPRRKSIVKSLAKYYGGTWAYIPQAYYWVCDDGRYVCRVACSLHDDECDCPPRYCLYNPGEASQWIHWD